MRLRQALLLALGLWATAAAAPSGGVHSPADPPPPACPSSTPGPSGTNKCPLQAPGDPEFASICHPGADGHAGGAETPQYRCPRVNYTDGVFRCEYLEFILQISEQGRG